jgi:hypothetical protein
VAAATPEMSPRITNNIFFLPGALFFGTGFHKESSREKKSSFLFTFEKSAFFRS